MGLAPINRNDAEHLYAEFVGKDVCVFYEDSKGNARKMVGIITRIEGNTIFLRSEFNGWAGTINCDICRIGNISSREGWGTLKDFETK